MLIRVLQLSFSFALTHAPSSASEHFHSFIQSSICIELLFCFCFFGGEIHHTMDCHPNVPSEIPHLVGPAGDSPFGDGSFSRSNTAFRILPNSLPDDWTPRDTEAVRLRVQVQAPKLRCSASKNRPLVTEPLKIGEEHGSPLGSPLAHDHLLSFHQSPRLLLQDHSANVLKRPPALSHQQAAASRNGKLENSRSISSLWNNDEIAAKDIDTADTPL